MQTSLGDFLRQLRRLRGLSQAEAALASAISRVTLNRWENGTSQPYAAAMEALLTALCATPQEQQQAFSLLGTPSARTRTRDMIVRLGEQQGIGAGPEMGDLLRTLRMRRGLSQGEVAELIGVAERTLRRWEKSEVWPSAEQLHWLCCALDARPAERVALTDGPALPAKELSGAPEDLWFQAHILYFYTSPEQRKSLKDLSFFLLENQAWPHALRSEAGRTSLSRIYGFHAAYLSYHQRWKESRYYSDRALDLLSPRSRPDEMRLLAGLSAARAVVYGGENVAPKRGLEMLYHWQDVGKWIEGFKWPTYKAWLLSEMAEYLVLDGEIEKGLDLMQQACDLASMCENRSELSNRLLNAAQLLVWAGKPEEALSICQSHNTGLIAQFQLVEAEAFLNIAENACANVSFQRALCLIENKSLTHLTPRAQKLERRLVNVT
ncbi:XRE family transcriptional regulator [bacterium]|nr:MAG: XRE family transcriptional regulator [bacterium]